MLQKSFEALPEHAPLLAGIHPQEIIPLLSGLSAKSKRYQKGEYLLHQGSLISGMGFIVTGMVQIMKEDFLGKPHDSCGGRSRRAVLRGIRRLRHREKPLIL